MAITRVIATFPYFSGVPEDASTNTFYFSGVATPDAAARLVIKQRLDTFYGAIDTYMSPVIQGSLVNYKFYNQEDPIPRVPVETFLGTGFIPGSSGLPEEVAVCLSYAASPTSGASAARRRGRLYLGPLSQTAYFSGSSSAFSAISSTMRTVVANAAVGLAGSGEVHRWCVYSPTDGIARNIVSGWVDNSFDTQRRRGRLATARTTWVAL